MNTTHVLTVAAILIAAWFLFRHDWKKKPLTDFTRHLDARDWRRYEFAIRELAKRGQDISIYLPQVVGLLAADSKIQRAMGQRVIEKCYPEIAKEIAGYSYMQDISTCSRQAAPLLFRFAEKTQNAQQGPTVDLPTENDSPSAD